MALQSPPGRPGLFDIQGFVRKYIPFSQGPIVTGLRSGRGQYRIVTFSAPNSDTTISHTIGHVPEQYHTVRNSSGGVVFDASNGTASWTGANIVLRATVAGTYTLWIA